MIGMQLLPGCVNQIEEIFFAIMVVEHAGGLRLDSDSYSRISYSYTID